MKAKNYFRLLFFAFFIQAAYAQKPLIPEVVSVPVVGFEQLAEQNPYIVKQYRDSTQSWMNSEKITHSLSDVPGYFDQEEMAFWDNNEWTVGSQTKDSLVSLDLVKLDLAVEEQTYNYPGFSGHQKLKYQYNYNSNNQLASIEMKMADPDTSNNYVFYGRYDFSYDGSGKRIRDSLRFMGATYPYMGYYIYDVSGKMIKQFWVDTDPGASTDTTYIQFYTYNGDQLIAQYGISNDASTGTWDPNSCDSFEYNAQGLVSNRITYAFMSVNGSDFFFGPSSNEAYTYSATGKLLSYITKDWVDSSWTNMTKTNILYNGADEPTIGLGYSWNGSDWETTASSQMLFSAPSGLTEKSTSMRAELYPNPASSEVYFKLSNTKANEDCGVQIYDLTGKKVFETQVRTGSEGTAGVYFGGLVKGIYILHLSTKNGDDNSRLMVN